MIVIFPVIFLTLTGAITKLSPSSSQDFDPEHFAVCFDPAVSILDRYDLISYDESELTSIITKAHIRFRQIVIQLEDPNDNIPAAVARFNQMINPP